ncbi:hypothetical protein B566_EDAN012140 [Ephemera danica]|nr:hypothetical protein B566_EDAN012140 [Ephemera danica]
MDQADTGSKAKMANPASHFSGGAHFYEEVEDTKDSVWLVQMTTAGDLLCTGKGWHEPLLLLALPRGTKAKDKVLMQIFQSTRPQAIVSWVRQQLSERVEQLPSASAASAWLSPQPKDTLEQSNQVRVLLAAGLSRPPLFLAALSVKFAGRIRFGLLKVTKEEEAKAKKELGVSKLPAYLVSTPQGNHTYSSGREEHIEFKSMLSFLRTVQPEANDALLLSLFVCQFLALVHLATKRSILAMAFTFFLHNIVLLTAWLILISLGRVPIVATTLAEFCACTARWFALSTPGLWLRADIQLLSRHSYVLLTVTILFLYAVRKFLLESADVPQPTWRLDVLTRLVPTNLPMQAADEQPGPDELLIQRLAVPGLWLTPLVYADYLRSLARWRHRGIDIKRDKMSRALVEEMSKCKDSELSEDDGPPSHALKAAECPICLESYSRGILLCALPCGHTFHEACVMAWLLRDHHSCPSCRWPAYKRKRQ